MDSNFSGKPGDSITGGGEATQVGNDPIAGGSGGIKLSGDSIEGGGSETPENEGTIAGGGKNALPNWIGSQIIGGRT
jgi:hypothetical protein